MLRLVGLGARRHSKHFSLSVDQLISFSPRRVGCPTIQAEMLIS